MVLDPRISDLYSSFCSRLDQEFDAGKKDSEYLPLGDWALQNHIVLDGKPFSFKHHEYLIEPYADTHPFQVELKATQLGLTSKALLRVVHGCRYGKYRGIMYFFPSRTDVTDMSKGRLTPLIDENPENIGKWIKETDATNIKKIWNSFLYLRGMMSRVGLKCHDDKTEILTKSGWKLFKDTTMDDEFATRSPSGTFMWQRPIALYDNDYQGKMLHFLANGLDFCVTPTHRLLLINDEHPEDEWFDISEDIKPRGHIAVMRTCKKWKGYYPDFLLTDCRNSKGVRRFIILPGNKINNAWEDFGRYPERRINLWDFVAFLGLYIAEGSCSGVASGKRKFV